LTDTRWITRVPENIKLAKITLVQSDSSAKTEIQDSYKTKSVSVSNSGVNQRWLVVFSEAAYTREMVTFNINLEKKRKEAESALGHL